LLLGNLSSSLEIDRFMLDLIVNVVPSLELCPWNSPLWNFRAGGSTSIFDYAIADDLRLWLGCGLAIRCLAFVRYSGLSKPNSSKQYSGFNI
jgi:hypothetical protein